MRRRIYLNLAVFGAVAALFIYWAATNIVTLEFIERPYRVTADFENAMGVLPNAEVTYLGTQVGLVDTVDRVPGGVRVGMKIRRGKTIPAAVSAHIWRKSALGEQYVDFANPDDLPADGPALEDGDHIGRERTTIPIEFAEMLRAADALLSSIDPEDLATITHELGTGLLGRTDDLRSLIVEGGRVAAVMAERTDALDRLATNNTRLTRVLAAHGGSFADAVADLRAVTTSLAGVKDSIGPLIDDGAAALGKLAPVTHERRDSLVCLFRALGDVIDVSTTDSDLAGLEALLVDMPVATDQLKQAIDVEDGPDGRPHQWVRVDLTDDSNNPATDFAPDRATPPGVPSVPACEVQFASVDPGEASDGPSGVTPATGGALAGGLGVAVALLAVLFRSLRGPEHD